MCVKYSSMCTWRIIQWHHLDSYFWREREYLHLYFCLRSVTSSISAYTRSYIGLRKTSIFFQLIGLFFFSSKIYHFSRRINGYDSECNFEYLANVQLFIMLYLQLLLQRGFFFNHYYVICRNNNYNTIKYRFFFFKRTYTYSIMYIHYFVCRYHI